MKTQSKKAQVMEARKQQLEAKKQVLAEKKANRKAMSKANKEMVKAMPKWMKISYGVIAVSFAGIIGIASLGSTDTESPADTPVTEQVQEQAPVTEDTVAFEDMAFPEQVNTIAEKHGKGMVQDVLADGGEVYITLEMTENFTNNLMVSGMKRQAFNIIKDLQPLVEANEVRNVTVLFTAMFMDKYGNESQGNAGMFSINASELVKVNFDNVFPEDMENFCTSTYVHPAFKK